MNVKIADFGLARIYQLPPKPLTKNVITLLYRAPEVLMGYQEYSASIDIWSLGCVFYELITGRPLIESDSETDHLIKTFRIFGVPNSESFPELNKCKGINISLFPNVKQLDPRHFFEEFDDKPVALDLLQRMLLIDPIKRIQA